MQLFTATASILIGFLVNLFSFDSSLFFYVCVLLSGFYVLTVLYYGKLRFFSKNRALIFLMTVLLLSILINWRRSDIYSFIRWLEVFILLFATMIYTGAEDMDRIRDAILKIFRTITVVTFAMTAGSLVLAVSGQLLADAGTAYVFANPISSVLKWNDDLRNMVLGGLYLNGNQLGLNAYCSGMLSAYYLTEKNRRSVFDILNILVQSIGIVVCGCRSIMIAIIVTIALTVFRAASPRMKKVSVVVILLLVGAVCAVTATKMQHYGHDTGFEALLNHLSGDRFLLWKYCLGLFRENTLFGIGLGNIHALSKDVMNLTNIGERYNNAHNILVNILSMTGLVGLFSFSLIARDSYYGLKRVSRILGVFCIGMIIADMFDIFLIFTDKLPSLLFPMIAGYGFQLSLREPKPFYFYSNLVEEDIYKELYTKAERPGQQAQKFNRLIAEGFAYNGRKIECDTSVLASDAIVDYRFRNLKNHGMYHYSLSINVPGIKTLWNILGAFFHTLYAQYGACVIDVLSIDNAVGALAASRLRGMPNTGIVTDLPEHFSGDGLYARIVYKIMSWCDSYVFLTEYMDEKLNPKHKPYIVMEGLCDVHVERETVSERDRSIIFAGEIDEQNGVMTFVRAFNQWGDHGYDLYYYGTGEAMEMLKQESEGNDRIHIMGLLLNRDLLKVMNRASLLVNPRPIYQDFVKYSFPSKVMEYMNTGTYHASSHLACIPDEYFEYIGDMGDGSTEDILKFLKEFEHMTPEYLNEQGRRAQEFVLKNKNNAVQAARIAELLDGMYE